MKWIKNERGSWLNLEKIEYIYIEYEVSSKKSFKKDGGHYTVKTIMNSVYDSEDGWCKNISSIQSFKSKDEAQCYLDDLMEKINE